MWDRISRLMPWKNKYVERHFWVLSLFLVAGGLAVATFNEVGPVNITDSAGATQITLGTAGQVTAASLRKIVAGTTLKIEASNGTDRASINERGTLALLQPSGHNQWGTVNVSNTAGQVLTASIGVSFAVAEADSNYEVFLTTKGLTAGSGARQPFYMGQKYTTGFEVRNPDGHVGSNVDAGTLEDTPGFHWLLVRTADSE